MAETARKTTSQRAKKVSLNDMVDVRSCVVGELIWVSTKTKYQIRWGEFGATNPMTVADLIDMRNGSIGFFKDNYVILDGDNAFDVMEYLGILKYYSNYETLKDIDGIFKEDPDTIGEIVSGMSTTCKELVARRAVILRESGKLDSIKVFDAVGRATGFDISGADK